MNQEKNRHFIYQPLVVIVLALIGLALFIVPVLKNGIISTGVAISVSFAICSLTYAVSAIQYSKRFSFFSLGVLFLGVFFYSNSVICYIFGSFLLNFLFRDRLICSWGFSPNQTSHSLVMIVLGILMIIVAIKSLIASKERNHIKKVLEYVLIGLGALQSIIGGFGLLIR